MAGINKVILVGNVGDDPQMRKMPNGNGVANLTIATSESWRDKATGEARERTEWHKVVFFGPKADIIGEHVKTGTKLYVEGALRTRKWEDKSGVERYTTEIIGDKFEMLSAKNPSQSRAEPKPEPAKEQPFDEDDIPF